MRIIYHSFNVRIAWFLKKPITDTDKIVVEVVGTEQELRDLMKKIHLECAK